ncbi:MAG: hypothetical protein J6N81_06590 [Treponema sp.]|nr:hypothetical protein [Treponema sp.]
MKKILVLIALFFLSLSLFAGTIADVANGKFSLDDYIPEYEGLSQIKQIEKFKQDCKIIARAITEYGAKYAVIKSTDILDVDNGFAVYSIKFDLETKVPISEWIKALDTIKGKFSSLSNTHFTPDDCSRLLPDGQYLDKENWIAVEEFYKLDGVYSTHLAALGVDYIQFSIEYDSKLYKSGKNPDMPEFLRPYNYDYTVVIKIPVDAKLENIKAKAYSMYGAIFGYGPFNGTPSKKEKLIAYDVPVMSAEEFQKIENERIARAEIEKKAKEEAAERERQAEETRLEAERKAEQERIAAERQNQLLKKYSDICKNFVSSVDGNTEDLKKLSLTMDGNGNHLFAIPVSFLSEHGMDEEIIIRNFSGQTISVIVEAVLNGKTHSWKKCLVKAQSENLWTGQRKYYGEEHLEGEYDNDMSKEFKRVFGNEGKFSKQNQNSIVFTLRLDDSLMIQKICKDGDDICFEISRQEN